VVSELPEVVQRYRLCQRCAQRQAGKQGDFDVSEEERSCYICGGLLGRAPQIAKKLIRQTGKYEFETFSVGLSMPEGIQEREDELRSQMRIKGRETAKTELSRLIVGLVSNSLGKAVDKAHPDLMMLVSLDGIRVTAFSRPLYIYGRYVKPPGIYQRREFCEGCRGRGCQKCGYSGYSRKRSVEGVVRNGLRELGSRSMRFTWIGTEDRSSRVFSPGRPFVVEVKNPLKRVLKRKSLKGSFPSGRVRISDLRALPSKPLKLPSFRFVARISATVSSELSKESIEEMERLLRNTKVEFDRANDRTVTKRVYGFKAKLKGKRLDIEAELDGGLPVKRFVRGDLVTPSVSELLKTEVECRAFDIRRVVETSEFVFA
jgi:tRNA pseudouridine synthase 10